MLASVCPGIELIIGREMLIPSRSVTTKRRCGREECVLGGGGGGGGVGVWY